MDEMVVAQSKYISSKRASRVSGYAQDYIGQMVRMGKLPATKVGRSWFVDESALLALVSDSKRLESPSKELADLSTKVTRSYKSTVTAGIQYPSTWSPVIYQTDESPLYPNSDSRDVALSIAGVGLPNGTEKVGVRRVSSGISASPRLAPRNMPNSETGSVSATSIDGVRFKVSGSVLPTHVTSTASETVSVPVEVVEHRASGTAREVSYGRSVVAVTCLTVLLLLIPLVG